MTAHTAHQHLTSLTAERSAATLAGLDRNATHLRDLDDEIEATRQAFIGAAVTDIATFRAQLNGPLWG